ncbi:MAG: hypothetical protein K0R57_325 [Paenibacillaceae bacterium]|jgi:hypothetical protein|nr:hypothetical protein [Paenibacillaceae bacterium]
MLTLRKHELEGHDVFEIMRGHEKESHWLDDSLYVTEECFGSSELTGMMTNAVAHFNYYGPTELNQADWEAIKRIAYSSTSEATKQLVREIDAWANECFKTERCFTVCGP